jgi:[protein-PII] uridylyltransferase
MNTIKASNYTQSYLKEEVHTEGQFYRRELARLRWRFLSGFPVLKVIEEYGALVEKILQPFLTIEVSEEHRVVGKRKKACWLAVDELGSLELAPSSPVHLVLLTQVAWGGGQNSFLEAIRSKILDVGINLQISHFTVKECILQCQKDTRVCMSLLSARWISGEKSIEHDFKKRLYSALTRNRSVYFLEFDNYCRDQLVDPEKDVYSLDATLDLGVGGLWYCRALIKSMQLFAGSQDLLSILKKTGISSRDWEKIQDTRKFFLRIKTYCQLTKEKSRLESFSKNGQKIAQFLGYRKSRYRSNYELMLRDIIRKKKHILTILVSYLHRNNVALNLDLQPLVRQGVRLNFQKDFLEKDKTPKQCMELFKFGQFNLEMILNQLKPLIKNNLGHWKVTQWNESSMHDNFKIILSNPGYVGSALREMRDLDFLSRYLPEYGRIDCFPILNHGYLYTIDEHTIRSIEFLDRIFFSTSPKLEEYKGILQNVIDPSLLYISLLLHKSGVALSDDSIHSSTQAAANVLQRMNFGSEDSEKVLMLVREQSLLSHVSQHRDFDDPQIIEKIYTTLETTDNLNMLLLHTVANLSTLSKSSWSERSHFLLRSLYFRVMDRIMLGRQQVSGSRDTEVLEIQRRVLEKMDRAIEIDSVLKHFSFLPAKYALYTPVNRIISHIQMYDKLKDFPLVTEWTPNVDGGYLELNLVGRDTQGLFSKISGTLASVGAKLISAQLNTRRDGIVIDTFQIDLTEGEGLIQESDYRYIEKTLINAILGRVNVQNLVKNSNSNLIEDQNFSKLNMTPRVRIDNNVSEDNTVVEVESKNQIDLTYRIALILADLGLNIVSAKLNTEQEYTFAVFYVQNHNQKKITQGEKMTQIIERLRIDVGS